MNREDVCAGIVLYNPDPARLRENLQAVSGQVNQVLLVDNASANESEIRELLGGFPNAVYVRNARNFGIAHALNQIHRFAEEGGYPVFLTLDQDSVCGSRLVAEYLSVFEDGVGQVTCKKTDRRGKPVNPVRFAGRSTVEVESCITSGCLNSTEAVSAAGGYLEKLFIDGVDHDLSLRLRERGCRILCINYDGLLHELGSGGRKRLSGKPALLANHAPWRNYYARRNMIYVARRHYSGMKKVKAIGAQIVYGIGAVVLEDQKALRLKQNVRGIADGFRMPLDDGAGKYGE